MSNYMRTNALMTPARDLAPIVCRLRTWFLLKPLDVAFMHLKVMKKDANQYTGRAFDYNFKHFSDDDDFQF